MSRLLPFFVVLLVVAFFTRLDFFFHLLYALFGVYLLGRLWARRSLAAVTLQRNHDRRVFLGEFLDIEIKINNRSWLPVLWMRLSDNAPADLTVGASWRQVISLLPREQMTLSYTVHGRRRGYYKVGPMVTLGGDLLGTTTYEYHEVKDDYVIVYPKIVALRDLGLPSLSPFGTWPSHERIFEDPTRIQGVRDYQPGDSLRRMDWKTTSRVGSLQVRRYEPAISLDTAILLNLDGNDYELRYRHQSTELGIVVAASVAVHLIEERQTVGLFTNGRDPFQSPSREERGLTPAYLPRKGRGHLMHMLDLLARIEVMSEGEPVPFLGLLNQRSLGLPWGSTVIVITAREVEGLLHTLLTLRRRGLVVILVLTCPGKGFSLTAERAGQIGVRAHRVWSEKEMDVWR